MNCNLQRTKTVFAIIAIFMGLIVVSMTYTWLDVRRISLFRYEVTADRLAILPFSDGTKNRFLDLFKTEKNVSTPDVTYNSTKQSTVSGLQLLFTKSAFLNGTSMKPIKVPTISNATPMKPIRVTTIANDTLMKPISITTIANDTSMKPIGITTIANGTSMKPISVTTIAQDTSIKPISVTTIANDTLMKPISITTIANDTSMKPKGITTIANGTPMKPISVTTIAHDSSIKPISVTTRMALAESSSSRPDDCSNCFPMDFTSMISPDRLCDGGRVDVLLLVLSSVTNRLARDAIRSTWGSMCNSLNSTIRLAFVIGNNLNKEDNSLLLKESGKFQDIIQADFRDTYANLTYKTITGLKWSHTYCSNAKYVMKTDDDMFVNTELLPIMLQAAPNRNFMGGFCWGPSSPHRSTSSKWYVSINQYRKPLFPAMCSGTGYLLSIDVVGNIVKVSRNIPFFYLEDVYVAICVNKFGVSPVSLTGFANMFVNSPPCVYRNSVITSHQLSPETLKQYWAESRTCPLSQLRPEQVFHSRVV